jgi:anti-sigma B factor antagonist
MPTHHSVVRVYETGPLTVVGFGPEDLPEFIDFAECRDEIVDLIRTHGTKTLAFDLTGVKYVPSGMLGLLASLRKEGVEVHLYNPSPDVREVLAITKLDQLLHVHELAL